ncbi:unnamed protein product [Leuciscus chuanchicus]
MAVSSSSAGPPGFGPQPWGGTSAGFLQDSFSPLTQGFDAYVLKVAAAATQAWWQMADLQASAGQGSEWVCLKHGLLQSTGGVISTGKGNAPAPPAVGPDDFGRPEEGHLF